MMVASLIVASVACLAAVALAVVAGWLSRGVSRPLVGRSVLVSTVDGGGVRGVMTCDHRDRVTLAQAVVVDAQGGEHEATGLVHIPAAQIMFIQEPR